jgi:hypothetical protein
MTPTKSHDHFLILNLKFAILYLWFSPKPYIKKVFFYFLHNNIFISTQENSRERGRAQAKSTQSYYGDEMMQYWCALDWKSPSFLFALLWFMRPGFEPTQPFGRENISYIRLHSYRRLYAMLCNPNVILIYSRGFK